MVAQKALRAFVPKGKPLHQDGSRNAIWLLGEKALLRPINLFVAKLGSCSIPYVAKPYHQLSTGNLGLGSCIPKTMFSQVQLHSLGYRSLDALYSVRRLYTSTSLGSIIPDGLDTSLPRCCFGVEFPTLFGLGLMGLMFQIRLLGFVQVATLGISKIF